MDLADWVSNGISLIFLALIFWEFRLGRKQREREAIFSLHKETQVLHFEAMNDPERLAFMTGNSTGNQKERRFWQLWLNHVEITYRQRSLFSKFHWNATLADFRDFFELPGLRTHWDSHQHLYSTDFQGFINDEVIIKKAEAPLPEPSA